MTELTWTRDWGGYSGASRWDGWTLTLRLVPAEMKGLGRGMGQPEPDWSRSQVNSAAPVWLAGVEPDSSDSRATQK